MRRVQTSDGAKVINIAFVAWLDNEKQMFQMSPAGYFHVPDPSEWREFVAVVGKAVGPV